MHFDDDDCEEVLTAGRTRLLKTPTGGLRLRRLDGGRWLAYHDSDVVLMLSQALDRASAAEQRIRELEAERDELRAKVDALAAESKRAAASELLYENTFEALAEVCDGNDPGSHLPLVHVQRAKAAGVETKYAVGYYRGIHDALVSRRGIEALSDEEVAAEFVRRFGPARIDFRGDNRLSAADLWDGHWESWVRGDGAEVHDGPVSAILRAARLARGE